MRTRLLLLTALALCGLLFAGCQPSTQGGPPAPTSGAGPLVSQPGSGGQTTITLWTIWNTEPRQGALAEIVKAFETANPGIKVQVNTQEPDAYKTGIRVALGGNQPPDIFFVWSGEKMLHNFVRGGNVADLSADLDANSAEWRNRFPAASLKMYEYDGKTYGVPYLLQCTFLFYNKKLFSEKGWQAPKTWPELLALSKKIKAAGLIPISLGNLQKWPAHHYPCVLAQRLMGADAVERQYDPTGPGAYDDPGWVKSLDMFKQLVDAGAFPKSPNGVDRSAARVLFYSGKAAMFYTGTWDLARLSKGGEAPESFWDSWDFVNFPSVPGGKGEQGCLEGSPDGYVVSAKSPNHAAAVKFLQFMTSVEQAKGFVTKCQELVQVKGAVTQENAGARLAKYMQMVEQAPRISAWADTMMEESVAQAYMGAVQELLDGKATSAQVMDRVRERQKAVRRELEAKTAKP